MNFITHPLRRLVLSRRNTYTCGYATYKAITGYEIQVKSPAIIMELDQIIIEILNQNNYCGDKLQAIVERDDSCTMARILYLFEGMKHGIISAYRGVEHIRHLEQLMEAGKLTQRESYFASAAVAYHRGQFQRCGLLLESVLMNERFDPLAALFAQDSYSKTEGKHNVLNCIIRHFPSLDRQEYFYDHHLAMLANGYVEVGQLGIAEEVAQKAIALTGGKSFNALKPLLSCHQLAARSPELLATLGTYEGNFEGTALSAMMYYKGLANIMRGGYIGACRSLDSIIDMICMESAVPTIQQLEDSIFLLWTLSLNTEQQNAQALSPLWNLIAAKFAAENGVLMVDDIVRTLLLANAGGSGWLDNESINSQHTKEKTAADSQLIKAENDPGLFGSVWQTMIGDSGSKSDNTLQIMQDFVRDKCGSTKLVSNEDACKLLVNHLSLMKDSQSDSHCATRNLVHTPSLDRIQYKLPSEIGYNDVNDQRQRQGKVILAQAIAKFASGEHKDACNLFLKVENDLAVVMSNDASKRELLRQISIEGFLRSNQTDLALMYLNERSAIAPQDAQCWRRISNILKNRGDDSGSRVAQYTAWQLGIGQGGFGGPR